MAKGEQKQVYEPVKVEEVTGEEKQVGTSSSKCGSKLLAVFGAVFLVFAVGSFFCHHVHHKKHMRHHRHGHHHLGFHASSSSDDSSHEDHFGHGHHGQHHDDHHGLGPVSSSSSEDSDDHHHHDHAFEGFGHHHHRHGEHHDHLDGRGHFMKDWESMDSWTDEQWAQQRESMEEFSGKPFTDEQWAEKKQFLLDSHRSHMEWHNKKEMTEEDWNQKRQWIEKKWGKKLTDDEWAAKKEWMQKHKDWHKNHPYHHHGENGPMGHLAAEKAEHPGGKHNGKFKYHGHNGNHDGHFMRKGFLKGSNQPPHSKDPVNEESGAEDFKVEEAMLEGEEKVGTSVYRLEEQP